jgi:hypothetical protein
VSAADIAAAAVSLYLPPAASELKAVDGLTVGMLKESTVISPLRQPSTLSNQPGSRAQYAEREYGACFGTVHGFSAPASVHSALRDRVQGEV